MYLPLNFWAIIPKLSEPFYLKILAENPKIQLNISSDLWPAITSTRNIFPKDQKQLIDITNNYKINFKRIVMKTRPGPLNLEFVTRTMAWVDYRNLLQQGCELKPLRCYTFKHSVNVCWKLYILHRNSMRMIIVGYELETFSTRLFPLLQLSKFYNITDLSIGTTAILPLFRRIFQINN